MHLLSVVAAPFFVGHGHRESCRSASRTPDSLHYNSAVGVVRDSPCALGESVSTLTGRRNAIAI